MKARIGTFAVGIALASAAKAADLPALASPAPPSCFSSFWNWVKTSENDCPLIYAGITLYGSLDVGATYLSNGAGLGPSTNKLNYFVQKNSSGSKWLPAYNALSLSVLGLKMKENLGDGWSLVGVLEAGINPYSGMFYNGPFPCRQQRQARQQIPLANLKFRLEPRRSVGQFSGLYRHQQPSLWHAHLRPHRCARL